MTEPQNVKRWPWWAVWLVILAGCGLCIGACTLIRRYEVVAGIGMVVLALILIFIPVKDGDA